MNIRKIVITLFVLLLINSVYPQKVEVDFVKLIAKNAFNKRIKPKSKNNQNITKLIPNTIDADTLFYIVNFESSFVIISAERATQPILGYSSRNRFDISNTPPALKYLLNCYKEEIKEIRKLKAKPTEKIKKKWDELSDGLSLKSTTNIVEPLINTEWSQSYPFNMYCPSSSKAGCVAIAMAQVLHYWGCRVEGTGLHSYASDFGTEYANFANANYQWSDMDTLVGDSANALLIYHCGVSVDMVYGLGGSNASSGKIDDAFEDYFGFKSSADYRLRFFQPLNWKANLKENLDNGWPIIYGGQDDAFPYPEQAHAWVIDGYNSDDNFSCKWGWPNGEANGYFSIGGFNPVTINESYDFNEWQEAIFDIEPIRNTGIEAPELSPQTFTFNTSGYNITIPASEGASSYEWTTNHGTITGTGTSVTLETGCSATVQVRAFNDQCEIYSSYDSELITIEYAPISGSSIVCISGSAFTLNAPPDATISWTHSSNLSYLNGQGTANYSVKAIRFTTSGAGWVEAEISTGSCSPIILHKDIWVGKPGVPTTNPSGYPTIDVPLEAYLYIALGNTPGASASMSTTWWSTGSIEVENATSSGCTFHAYDTGIGNFYVTTQNACGTSAPGGGTVDVYSGGGGELGPVALSIMPNPADDYVNAEIIDDSLEIDNTDLQIKLFNYRSTPVYMGNSHQKSFRINTGQLPRGLYILQVIYNGKKYSKQVLVEH